LPCARARTYRADVEGLTEVVGRQIKTQIPWSRVGRLSRIPEQERTWAYEAVGNAGLARISWLALSFGSRALLPGHSAITPEQLFALAVKHSGVEPSE
jgi:hypothetical protein